MCIIFPLPTHKKSVALICELGYILCVAAGGGKQQDQTRLTTNPKKKKMKTATIHYSYPSHPEGMLYIDGEKIGKLDGNPVMRDCGEKYASHIPTDGDHGLICIEWETSDAWKADLESRDVEAYLDESDACDWDTYKVYDEGYNLIAESPVAALFYDDEGVFGYGPNRHQMAMDAGIDDLSALREVLITAESARQLDAGDPYAGEIVE